MKRWIFRCYLFVSIFLLINGALYAAEVDVEINTGMSYESNVFRSFAEAKDDAYFTLAPKASLKMPFNKTYINTNLRTALEQHVNESEANLQELIFSGLGRFSPSEYLSFGLRDDFILSGRLSSAETLSDYTKLREYLDNQVVADVKHEFKPGILIATLGYTNFIRNYRNDQNDDWMAHSGYAQAEYIIGHLTSTQLNVGLKRKIYNDNSDINYFSIPINATIKRKLSSKVESSLSVGIENRQYSENEENTSWSKPTVVFETLGKFSPKTSSSLVLHRRIYDSDVTSGSSFTSTAADVSIALDLKYNLQLVLNGLYSRNIYIEKSTIIDSTRKDNVFNGQSSIRYNLSKWGAIVLSYGYERRTSDISDSIYNQNTVDVSYVVIF
jgi:hypothetical protein